MNVQMESDSKTVRFCLKLLLLNVICCYHMRALEAYELSNTTLHETSEEKFSCERVNHGKTCCDEGEFQCGNGFCIPQKKVCDAHQVSMMDAHPHSFGWRFRWLMDRADCSDASDEVGCLGSSCASRTNKTCPHNCVDLPGNKSRCTCYKGYFLRVRGSEQTCQDIDECKIGVHLCSHDCVNLNGTFGCACRDGFQKDRITGACKAEDQNIQIIFNSYKKIYSYNLNTKKNTTIMEGNFFNDISYDPVTEIMYWSDKENIFRSYIPGAKGGNVTIGFPQLIGPSTFNDKFLRNSLSVDWTAGNIYWLSSDALNDSNTQVMVSKLDGRYVKTLCEVSTATSLVLDPEFGRMYWTSTGSEPHIGAAWMNGLFKIVIARLPDQYPIALTLDHLSDGRLYWADSATASLYYIYKDGTRPTKIISLPRFIAPVSMDVFENYIYWVSDSLARTDKFGRGQIEVLVAGLLDTSSVKIYHPRRTNKEIRPGGLYCTTQCSHLCLHIPRGYSCSCPDGNKLVSLMGEIVCDNGKENESDEPLACNCQDRQSVCNRSSPSYLCQCHYPCPEDRSQSDHGGLDALDKFTSNFRSTRTLSALLIIAAIVIVSIVFFCIISCWKK